METDSRRRHSAGWGRMDLALDDQAYTGERVARLALKEGMTGSPEFAAAMERYIRARDEAKAVGDALTEIRRRAVQKGLATKRAKQQAESEPAAA